MNSEQLINHLINYVTFVLEELNSESSNDFIHGEITAYIDILEQIQTHQISTKTKLDYVICKRYNI